MQFSYDVRPSLWQGIKANSHLVIAAVGTAALLGVAGGAMWLALASGERQAFADPKPQEQEIVARAGPQGAGADAGAQAAEKVPAAATTVSSQVAPKADAVGGQAAAEADIPALSRSDPRWTGEGKPPGIDAKAVAADAADTAADPGSDAAKTAFAEEDGDTAEARAADAGSAAEAKAAAGASPADDGTGAQAGPDPKAATAAIPEAEPEKPARQAGAAANGSILRAVTMRSGPKKGAAAIGTIPARSAVEVLSCKSWCEIVYKGKRGFIYKSFLKRGG